MTKAFVNLAPNNSTDANFRAWGSGISNQLTALGFNKTNDSSQITWTTVTKPIAGDSSRGYEMRNLVILCNRLPPFL